VVAGRVAIVAEQRARLLEALRARGIDVAPSQANVLWLSAAGLEGSELAHRLQRHGVLVAAGGPLGDPARVRASVHGGDGADRLLRALDLALA
jgi:histidinol-phosphate aminotransferase